MIFDVFAIFLSQFSGRFIVNEQTIPSSGASSKIVSNWCVTNMKTLAWLKIFKLAQFHRFLENIPIGFLKARLIRTQHKVKIVIQFHVSEQHIESRIKITDDAEFEVRLPSVLTLIMLLQFQKIEKVNGAECQRPAAARLV